MPVRIIEKEISPKALKRDDLPLLIQLATPYESTMPPEASGIADEGGDLTMYWTHGLTTQPDDHADAHADYAPGQ